MININETVNNRKNTKVSFKSLNNSSLSGITKAADIFIKSQENLSSTRFIQDTMTNWLPKAVFARSKADFAEMSFLEFLESCIFYFASPVLGEKLFRNKIFKNLQPKQIQAKINEQIPKTIEEITKNSSLSNEIKNRIITSKAGIVLSCAIIPAAEYSLSFAKNLFTLKTFKKSNFDNIANLDKTNGEKEDIKQQELVEKHAKYQLKKAGIISAAGILLGCALAHFGYKSEKLLTLSKAILETGKTADSLLKKAGINSKKAEKVLSKFSLDFANNNGKLALSKGQLALTAILGLFGYSKAAQDRGKLDKAEVWTRVPLVVFYTIFGSELFEKAFTKILEKKNAFPDLLKKNAEGKLITPLRKELPDIAEKLAEKKNTNTLKELSKLTKQKAFVSFVPYAFSLIFMGFTLSGVTRAFTQYRYNHELKNKVNNSYKEDTPEVYKDFKTDTCP